MNKAPTIGSYRRPSTPAPEPEPELVERAERVESPANTLSEGIQEDLRESLENTKGLTNKAQTYEELLAERDIALDKARLIVDQMLEKGFYEETFPIKLPAPAPITVTFRTRLHADYVRFLRALEVYMPKYMEEQREIQTRYFLAASLVQYKGKRFKTGPDVNVPEFEETLSWIEAQPERLIFLLANKLHMFDMQIQAVMSEGVVENF